MKLPENYYWIPGFENRYALCHAASLIIGERIRRGFFSIVYSFIAPGRKGRPTRLTSTTTLQGETVSLIKNPGQNSSTYYIDDIIDSVIRHSKGRSLAPKWGDSRYDILDEVGKRMENRNATVIKSNLTTADDIMAEIHRRQGVAREQTARQSECSEERSSTQTLWVVGQLSEDNKLSFPSKVESYTSEHDAEVKAAKLTSVHTGLSFVVLKTVRKYVNPGVIKEEM